MPSLRALNGSPASSLSFGCMQFGGTADAQASAEMFEACRAAGVNFFDTAHVYTGGEAERLLGQFVVDEREALIVATKAGYTGGSGRDNILRQFDESRLRMGLDMVDILYLHRWDGETPLEETFEALSELQQAGKIRHIGVSNFAAWQVMKAEAVAERFGTRVDILQPMYSLVKRQAEVEILPMAVAEGFAVASYSPLGGGLLTGKYAVDKDGVGETGRLVTDARYAARYGPDWMGQTATALAKLAQDRGVHPATLAVAWAAHHPGVSAPIISARSAEQLGPSLAAAGLCLSAAQYDEITRLSQSPAPATDRLEEAEL